MTEVRCPNCGTSFKVANGNEPTTYRVDGIHYLVPETIRNENKGDKMTERMKALEEAGVNVKKLRELMNDNSSFKDIFKEDDPILNELSNGGFIRNNELFRRWITAQTFRLINDSNSWTRAVRKHYDIKYAYKQTIRELKVMCIIARKTQGKDRRLNFFCFGALKSIFCDFVEKANNLTTDQRSYFTQKIRNSDTLEELYGQIPMRLRFGKYARIPELWINCFKGAGAYYTLQNVIRTHGLIVNGCKDMNESLETVERIYNDILTYDYRHRRWDILMSLLISSVNSSHFVLKY